MCIRDRSRNPRRAMVGPLAQDARVLPAGALEARPMVDTATLENALPHCLAETDLRSLGSKYEGKVRDNYSRDGERFIVVTDRISAFDRVLGTIPFKGQVLNRLAAWWFEK